jgi:hypothetical protein
MTFHDPNLLAVFAKERQAEMIASAAELQLVRRARASHPSRRRRRRPVPEPPTAA